MCIYGVFGLILAKNFKMNMRQPLMTLLSIVGSNWDKYGTRDSYSCACNCSQFCSGVGGIPLTICEPRSKFMDFKYI